MPKLVIKIADRGTNYTNQKNGESHLSPTGHMWWELRNDNGQVVGSYGFAPAKEGSSWGLGEVKYDDNIAYEFNTSQGDYQRSFEISQEQFDKLKAFGTNPFDKFDSTYNGLTNSCIDFTWKALEVAGFKASDPNGNLWPTWNIDNIASLPSLNPTENQLFISKEGGLFILDNKNQMTVKLFGNAEDVQASKAISLASDAAKLGSNKVLIQDSQNQNIADYQIKNSDILITLLSKYSLNTNLSDYSDSIPTIIINDGNGNNFNLSAFPNFSSFANQDRNNFL